MFRTGVKAALCPGACVIGRSPEEMKRIETLALKLGWSAHQRVSRSAKLVYHSLVDEKMFAAFGRLSNEIRRARSRQKRAMAIAGKQDGLSSIWNIMASSDVDWKDWKAAEGPLDIAALEPKRLGWEPRSLNHRLR